jgi:hypothetical protein
MVSVESPVRMSGPGRWKLEGRIGRIVSDLAVQRQAVLECWERRAQALERTGIFVIRRKHNDMIGDCVLGGAVTCQSRGDGCGGGVGGGDFASLTWWEGSVVPSRLDV